MGDKMGPPSMPDPVRRPPSRTTRLLFMAGVPIVLAVGLAVPVGMRGDQVWIAGLVALAVLAAGMPGVVLSMRDATRMSDLREAARVMADGELTRPVPVPDDGPLVELAAEVEVMRKAVRKQFVHFRDQSEDQARLIGELAQKVTELVQSR